jgi:hypothetical protein
MTGNTFANGENNTLLCLLAGIAASCAFRMLLEPPGEVTLD